MATVSTSQKEQDPLNGSGDRLDSAAQKDSVHGASSTPREPATPSLAHLQQHISKHAKARAASASIAQTTHRPLLDALAAARDARTSTHVLLLGDARLAPLARPLAEQLQERAQRVHVADLTCAGERVEHTLGRVVGAGMDGGGLWAGLRRLCEAAARAESATSDESDGRNDELRGGDAVDSTASPQGRVLIVLHTGAANLDPGVKPGALRPRAIAAFTTLVRVLASLSAGISQSRVRVLVTGLLPRTDMPPEMMRAADDALRDAATKAAGAEKALPMGVCFAPVPLAVCLAPVPLAIRASNSNVQDGALSERSVAIWTTQLAGAIDALSEISDGTDDDATRTLRQLRVQDVRPAKTAGSAESDDSDDKTCPHRAMRPAQDVFARIRYDSERFQPETIVVGYEDRHDGLLEMPFAAWHRESTHDDFVPLHRVRHFRTEDGQVLWDRRLRLDRVFGGG